MFKNYDGFVSVFILKCKDSTNDFQNIIYWENINKHVHIVYALLSVISKALKQLNKL